MGCWIALMSRKLGESMPSSASNRGHFKGKILKYDLFKGLPLESKNCSILFMIILHYPQILCKASDTSNLPLSYAWRWSTFWEGTPLTTA
jgi:hypothetical protein